MKISKVLAGFAATALLCTSTTYAQTNNAVAKVLMVQGSVLVKPNNDVRANALRKGMTVSDRQEIIVGAGSKLTLEYSSAGCEVSYGENMTIAIDKDNECAAGVAFVTDASQLPKLASNSAGSSGRNLLVSNGATTAVIAAAGIGGLALLIDSDNEGNNSGASSK